jgi:hypothetical protein
VKLDDAESIMHQWPCGQRQLQDRLELIEIWTVSTVKTSIFQKRVTNITFRSHCGFTETKTEKPPNEQGAHTDFDGP